MKKISKTLAIVLTLWSALYISRFTEYAGILLSPAQNQAIFLAFVMALAFLSFPAKEGGKPGRWYDWILVCMGVVPNLYVLFFFDTWQLHGGTEPKAYEIVFAVALAIVLLEGLRRVLGLVLSILLLCFLLHPIFCDHLPGIFFGRGYSIERVGGAVFFPPEGIYSMPLNIASTIVVGFLAFGSLLLASAAGQTLTDVALAAVGRVRGGAAKAACIGSGMFGMLSGSPSANVAVTGTFTIPMMKKTGYSPAFAGAVEAAASNGGGLMPPVMGAVAFVMADMLEIPYVQVCAVALVPGLLYYLGMFLMIDFEAGRLGLRGLLASEVPSLLRTLKTGWCYFLPVVVLIWLMFSRHFSPELSSFWASVSIVAVSWLRKEDRLGVHKILNAMEATGKNVVQIGLACAMAGIMMASLSLTGISVLLSGEIVRAAAGSTFVLLVLAAMASFVLGLGLPSIPCYISVSVLVAPALVQMGIPLMAAHLFVLWYAIASFITPPEGMAFFVAAAVAQAHPMRVGWRASLLAIGNFIIPFVWVYNTGLILIGSAWDIFSAILFTAIGVAALSAGIEGFVVRTIQWVHRIPLLAGGILVFFPQWGLRITGCCILMVILAQLMLSRNKIPLRGALDTGEQLGGS